MNKKILASYDQNIINCITHLLFLFLFCLFLLDNLIAQYFGNIHITLLGILSPVNIRNITNYQINSYQFAMDIQIHQVGKYFCR